MSLGTDVGSGHIDMSLVFNVFWEEPVFMCVLYFYMQVAFRRLCNNHDLLVIRGGRNIDITLVSLVSYEIRVFSQMPFFTTSLKRQRGKSVHGRIP